MNDLERDPVVARALRDLPIPDHDPAFWDRLDDRLDAVDRVLLIDDELGDALTPVDSVPDRRFDTGELPALASLRPYSGASRKARMRFLVAAVALAVVAIGTGVALRGSGDDPGTAASDAEQPEASAFDAPAPDRSTLAQPATPTTVATTGTTMIGRLAAGATPEDAVLRWIDALAAGDLEEATFLLGPQSSEYVAVERDGVRPYLLAAGEGYGAWVTSEDLEVRVLPLPDDQSAVVVVLSGTRQAEGIVQHAVNAIPAVEGHGGWYVEPAASDPEVDGRVRLVNPRDQGGSALSGDAPGVVIEATSNAPDATFWFSLDGEPFVRDDDGVWDPPGDLSTRTHLLVVAVTGERLFSAVAGEFLVED